MENKYWEEALKFKSKILSYVKTIFKVYGNELILAIEEVNLLENKDNCIESSTAIGYCMEEFLVSKLISYTKNNITPDYIITRDNVNTQSSSFDCYTKCDHCEFLINIKVDKNNNNAISAISQLYNDYVKNKPNFPKHFFVLKIFYSIKKNAKNISKIMINDVDGFFLEEINFALGHKQDNRNWSKNFNANSGRLQISKNDLLKNKLNDIEISYEKTKNFLKNIFNNNENNIK